MRVFNICFCSLLSMNIFVINIIYPVSRMGPTSLRSPRLDDRAHCLLRHLHWNMDLWEAIDYKTEGTGLCVVWWGSGSCFSPHQALKMSSPLSLGPTSGLAHVSSSRINAFEGMNFKFTY